MHRFTYVLTIILLFAASAIGFSAILPNQALLILRSNNFSDTEATITTLEYLGAHAQHILSNKFVIAEVPPSAETGVRSLYNVYKFFRTTQGTSTYTGEDLTCITAWNFLFTADTLGLDQQGTLMDDTVPPPTRPSASPVLQSISDHAPRYDYTSEYMIGKIAVGVIIPESNGGTENWTSTRLNTVFSHVVKGLNWWLGNYPGTVKATKPTFFYDKHFSVPCQYEPITCDTESQWVNDVMTNIGYPTGDKYKYVNDLRDKYHADWAYAAYIADSANDSDGYFAYGLHAYACIGGPYCVLNWRNDGWGITNFYRLFAHETGHVFGCADEYGSCGTYNYGYLSVPNNNCELNNTNSLQCMMRINTAVVPPCQYTIGQIGWRDSDSDGIPDPLDNPVTITINSQTAVDENGLVTVTGTADNIPFDSPTHPDCTVSKITAVKYQIDGGYWISATPADGAWGQQTEDFTFTTQELGPGDHVIKLQAFSNSGNVSDIMTRLVDRTPPVMGKVVDDGDYTYDESRLYASWSATDSETEVIEYMYAIGTSPSDPGSNYVKDWTSTGADAFVTSKWLNLREGTTYYFYVKAKNASGYWSDVATSDGIRLATIDIKEAKHLPVGTWVALHDKEIVGSDGIYQYIQEPDDYYGIKVSDYNFYQLGQLVTVRGFLKNIDGELQVINDGAVGLGSIVEPLKPLFMTNRTVGGGIYGNQSSIWEWRWIKEEAKEKWLPLYGLNNIGTLIKTTGKLLFRPAYGTFAYIDDGSKLNDGNPLGTNGVSIRGLRISVPYNVELPPVGTNLSVVGVSSSVKFNDDPTRLVMVRTQSDINIAGKAMISGTVKFGGTHTVVINNETPHPLPVEEYDRYWGLENEDYNMTSIRFHFAQFELENGYLAISYDWGRGRYQIDSPVSYQDQWTDWIIGRGIGMWILSTSSSGNSYGMKIDKYEYKTQPVPLAGETVVLNPGNRTTVTDSQGRFYFDNLEPGTYTVTPQLDGVTVIPSSATVTIDFDGQFKTGVSFLTN